MAKSDEDHYELAHDPEENDPKRDEPFHPFRDQGGGADAKKPRPRSDKDEFTKGGLHDMSAEERAALAEKAKKSHRKHLGEGIYVKLTPDGQIDQDKHCVACNNNLRGMLVDQVCPECGTTILRSIKGDTLKHCRPKWLDQVALGCTLAAASIGAVLFGALLLRIVDMAVQPATESEAARAPELDVQGEQTIALLTGIILAVMMLFRIAGFWLMTKPEPQVTDEPSEAKLDRKLIRLTVLASAGLLVVELLASLVMDMRSVLLSFPQISAVIGLVSILFLSRYLSRLAVRVPDEPLAQQTKIAAIGWAIALPLVWITQLLDTLFFSSSEGGSIVRSFLGLLHAVGGIAAFVLAIWSLFILLIYRTRCRQAAEDARRV